MSRSIIAEGRTTSDAISNGLKELNVSKDRVDIKILEEHEKRSFFSILAPRVVKVELTLKDEDKRTSKIHAKTKDKKITEEEFLTANQKLTVFLNDFIRNFENLKYDIQIDKEEDFIKINIDGEDAKTLIGYRGEVLNALQVILASIANKNSENKIRVILNISNYKEKREKALIELADKISKTVVRTGKSITLEPMMAYERKIIHSRLQENDKVNTHSIGEEPYRKIVISKNK